MRIILVLHNIRSIHNVGSILRTYEGFGGKEVICSGYTPYPAISSDKRLPHIIQKITKQIRKTALGAEEFVSIKTSENVSATLRQLKDTGYRIVGLEQDIRSSPLSKYKTPKKVVLLLGEEVEGIPIELRDLCDNLLEIPMKGNKESFNVSVAAGIALYELMR